MIPIGILTKDRVAYLDVTLRSLSATNLPDNIKVTVFDDSSSDPTTRRYYATNDPVSVTHPWPTDAAWGHAGLAIINHPIVQPTGIKDRVRTERLHRTKLGVVGGSCLAISRLFKRNPTAPGVILLQDDVVFNEDWYARIVDTVTNWETIESSKPLGLLAGVKINKWLKPKKNAKVVASGVTAQCLYISREAYAKTWTYFKKPHQRQTRFDDTVRAAISHAGFWTGCIYPFVCQHIGIISLVRPGRLWRRSSKGRIGYHNQPPYALSSKVKTLK